MIVNALLIAVAVSATPPHALANLPILGGAIQPVISATINGNPDVRCVVDTGATIGVLNQKLARSTSNAGTMPVHAAGGEQTMQQVRVNQIRLGTLPIDHVDFAQPRDGSDASVPCILGNNVWKNFTVDIDGKSRRLRLFAQGTSIEDILGSQQTAGTHLDPKIRNGIVETDVVIAGVHASASLDTGWTYASANSALLDVLGIRDDDSRIYSRQITQRFSDKPTTLKLVDVPKFTLGALHAETISLDVGSANERLVRSESVPHVQLGWEPLRHHRLLLDLADGDVALVP